MAIGTSDTLASSAGAGVCGGAASAEAPTQQVSSAAADIARAERVRGRILPVRVEVLVVGGGVSASAVRGAGLVTGQE
ncbi:hypothetical protein GCM10010388_63300 [Streptomyces mauvecolor]